MIAKQAKVSPKSRRGRPPRGISPRDLSESDRLLMRDLASDPAMTSTAAFLLLHGPRRGINPRTFRREFSKLRRVAGIGSGRSGRPRKGPQPSTSSHPAAIALRTLIAEIVRDGGMRFTIDVRAEPLPLAAEGGDA